MALLSIMSLLGEPFTFETLHEGRLVQDVLPVYGAETAQTSEGSDCFLDWHVEDAFSPDRCDYLGLLCLRSDTDRAARNVLAPTRSLVLDGGTEATLREQQFVVRSDIAHGDVQELATRTAALSGPQEAPEFCFDAVYMAPANSDDVEASAALDALRERLASQAVGHVMERGDLLVIDNRRVAHARTPFRPRFDGTDRWLLRAMVCSSLRQHRRRGAARVISARPIAPSPLTLASTNDLAGVQ